MDIELDGLDLTVPVPQMDMTIQGTRRLLPADVALMSQPAAARPVATVKKLRDSHHMVARLLAGSAKPFEVAAATGYTRERITMLQADPAFQELVEYYRMNLEGVSRSFHDRLVNVGYDAVGVLQERLDENPENFKNKELLEVATFVADRTGHGPKSTVVNVNLDLANRVEAARRRALLLDPPREGAEIDLNEAAE